MTPRLRGLLAFWPLSLPIVLLASGATAFPYPDHTTQFSDLTISHYPSALYLLRSLSEWGTIPLWSPAILSGYPFFANPLSGLWYPFGWPALALPLPLGFNLLVIAHLVWGGLGMFVLLRGESLEKPAALLGALAFAGLPKLYAHYGAGHLSLLYAVPWTPWLLWAARPWEKSGTPLRAGGPALRAVWGALPAVLLALIFVADPRWAVYAGLAFGAYVLWHTASVLKALQTMPRLGVLAGLTFLLGAPLALPLLEYTRLSTRAWMAGEDVLVFSLPPARLLGLLVPDFGGLHEWTLYPGAFVLALALLALLWPSVRREVAFWSLLAGGALLISLGDNLPGAEWLADLPGFSLLRVPPRFLFLAGFGLAALAAYGAQRLLAGPDGREMRRARLLAFGLAALISVLGAAAWAFGGTFPLNFGWAAGCWWVILAGLSVWARPGAVKAALWVALLLFCALDLAVMDRSLFVMRPVATVLAEKNELVRYLVDQRSEIPVRVYSPSYSLPQHVAARAALWQADGVDPLQLRAYAQFMEAATGVPQSGYSVTLPPFANGNPSSDNRGYTPDAERLGQLAADYVAAEFDLQADGLVLEGRFDETRLYRNLEARPYAWVQTGESLNDAGIQPAELRLWTPNVITLRTPSTLEPAWLVLAEIAYPGWQVWVDGQPGELRAVDGLLRGVHLPAGSHQVEFRFRPASLYWGLAAWGLAAGSLLVFVWAQWKKETESR